MLRLTATQLDTLERSYYVRDCGLEHDCCPICDDLVHAGQLVHDGALGRTHTRCQLPGLRVHELYELLIPEGR